MPSNCAFRPPSPPTSASRSRSSSIGGSSRKVAWKESLQSESTAHIPAAAHVMFHQGSVASSPDEPMPVPHRDIPRPMIATQTTKPRTAAAVTHSRPVTHGVASGAAGVSGYMPPKLSTLAPKLRGAGSGARPSTTHTATCGSGKEVKAVKPYNATGHLASCMLKDSALTASYFR